MEMPKYRVPLPKGASKEAIKLSEQVNKWANIEGDLLFQCDDLEMLINELGENHRRVATLKAILKQKEEALRIAEAKYEEALHKMCEAL